MEEVGMNSSAYFNSTVLAPTAFYQDKRAIAIVCMFLSIIIVSLIMNISVIIITYLGKCFEKNANSVYVFYLAIGDLLKCVSYLVNLADAIVFTFLEDGDYVPFQICLIPRVFAHFAINVSGYTLVLTSFVQYVAVVHPLMYTGLINGTSFSRITILGGWIFCALELTFLHVYHTTTDDNGEKHCKDAKLFGKHVNNMYLTDAIHFTVGFLLMIGLNAKIIGTIIQRTRRILPDVPTRKIFVKPVSSDLSPTATGTVKPRPSDTKQLKITSKEFGDNSNDDEIKHLQSETASTTTLPPDSTSLTMISISHDMTTSDSKQMVKNTEMSSIHGGHIAMTRTSVTKELHVRSTLGRTTPMPPEWSQKENTIEFSSNSDTITPTAGETDQPSFFKVAASLPSTSGTVISLSPNPSTPVDLVSESISTHQPRVVSPNHWKPFVTLIILVVSYIFCFGPYVLYTSFIVLTTEATEFSERQRHRTHMFSIFVLANTIVNPIIYSYRIDVYRHYIRSHILQALRNNTRRGNGNAAIRNSF